MLSLIILQVISSAFNLLGLSQFLTLAIWGALLIAHQRLRADLPDAVPTLATRRPQADGIG